ncbi:MAG: DNA primase [Elusimicrobiota bacterium]|nr:DNA primase [Elusimicrobiota bacterium]
MPLHGCSVVEHNKEASKAKQMTIPNNLIERIRLSTNIESIVSQYLPDLKKVGRNFKACCPFHSEKTPSFVVNSEKGLFKCFGCGKGGDVFKFIELMDGITWIEAVKMLAKKAGIEIQSTKGNTLKKSQKTKIFEILENAAKFYNRYLLESTMAQKARTYLQERGVSKDAIDKFKIGFSPKHQLLHAAFKRGFSQQDVCLSGLAVKTRTGNLFEYMSERITFPIFDVQGRVVAFGGRTISNQDAKYLNTPETSVYLKSANFYGLFQNLGSVRKERKMIVLEGYMDVVIPYQFGITTAVATLGTAFTKNHLKIVSSYCDSVTLLFDSDSAGRSATQRALEFLIEEGVECKVAALPERVDADEYLNQYGKESFLNLIEKSSKSAIDFMIGCAKAKFLKNDRAYSAEIKAKIIDELLSFSIKSKNDVLRAEHIKTISQNLHVDEVSVRLELKKKSTKNYRKNKASAQQTVPKIESKKVLTLEENLLHVILKNRALVETLETDYFKNLEQINGNVMSNVELISKIGQNVFIDKKCSKVFGLLKKGLSNTEIKNFLVEEEKSWWAGISIYEIQYTDIQEAFRVILKDVLYARIKKERTEIEKAVEQVGSSACAVSSYEKMQEDYNKLTKILKK